MLLEKFLLFEEQEWLRANLGGLSPKQSVAPAVPPPPIIPVTETGRETVLASKDYAATQKKRKGLLSTINAGETQSGTAYSSNFGTRGLLGAGGA